MIEWLVKKGGWKNENHFIWFATTMYYGFFASFVLFHKFGKFVILMPIILHLIPVVNAIWFTYIKKEKNEVYSKDCIPYNLIMIAFYVIVMYNINM